MWARHISCCHITGRSKSLNTNIHRICWCTSSRLVLLTYTRASLFDVLHLFYLNSNAASKLERSHYTSYHTMTTPHPFTALRSFFSRGISIVLCRSRSRNRIRFSGSWCSLALKGWLRWCRWRRCADSGRRRDLFRLDDGDDMRTELFRAVDLTELRLEQLCVSQKPVQRYQL